MQNKKTYTVYIVEDEHNSLEKIKRYVKERDELELKGYSDEADTALKDLKRNRVDLLFLDINLVGSSLTGFDILQKLKNPPAVIYITGHEEYAKNVFDEEKVDCLVDYILKPITLNRFNKAVDKFLELKRKDELLLLNKKLEFKQNGITNYIELQKILYIKSDKRDSIICTIDNEYRTNVLLKDIYTKLPYPLFLRIHRQHIVNLSHIQQHCFYSGRQDMVILSNGVKLRISEKLKAELKLRLKTIT